MKKAKTDYKFLEWFSSSIGKPWNEDSKGKIEKELKLIGNDGYQLLDNGVAKPTKDIWQYRVFLVNCAYTQWVDDGHGDTHNLEWNDFLAWEIDRHSKGGFEYAITLDGCYRDKSIDEDTLPELDVKLFIFRRKAKGTVVDIPIKSLEQNIPATITQEMRDKFEELDRTRETFYKLPRSKKDLVDNYPDNYLLEVDMVF